MATRQFDVLVVGDANPDMILAGPPRVPAYGRREQLVANGCLTLGGSGAITAFGLAQLGLRTAFVSRVVDDPAGAFVLDTLRRAAVDVSGCVIDGGPTPLTVVLTAGTDRAILTAPGCLDRLGPDDVSSELLARTSHLHAASYYLQPRLAAGLPELFQAAHEAGLSTSLDTNDDPSGQWHGVDKVLPFTDLLILNEREALALAGRTDGNLDEAVRDLARGGTTPVVKCGADGALTISDGELLRVPARRRVRVADTVGAGDNFTAGLLAAEIRNRPFPRAIEIAAARGTLSTRAAGGTGATPTWEEASL